MPNCKRYSSSRAPAVALWMHVITTTRLCWCLRLQKHNFCQRALNGLTWRDLRSWKSWMRFKYPNTLWYTESALYEGMPSKTEYQLQVTSGLNLFWSAELVQIYVAFSAYVYIQCTMVASQRLYMLCKILFIWLSVACSVEAIPAGRTLTESTVDSQRVSLQVIVVDPPLYR